MVWKNVLRAYLVHSPLAVQTPSVPQKWRVHHEVLLFAEQWRCSWKSQFQAPGSPSVWTLALELFSPKNIQTPWLEEHCCLCPFLSFLCINVQACSRICEGIWGSFCGSVCARRFQTLDQWLAACGSYIWVRNRWHQIGYEERRVETEFKVNKVQTVSKSTSKSLAHTYLASGEILMRKWLEYCK